MQIYIHSWMKKSKYKLGIVFIVTISLISFFSNKVNAQGCYATEWDNISKKYNLEEQFSRMQDITDQMGSIATDASDFSKSVDYTTFSSLQFQLESLKNQYDQALALAGRECDVIGADRAVQLNEKTTELESIRSEIQAVEEEKRKINEEERKLQLMDYEKAMQNYDKTLQYAPLSAPTIEIEELNKPQISPEFSGHRSKVLGQQTEKPTPTIITTKKNKPSQIQKKGENKTQKQPQHGFITQIFDVVRNLFSNLFKW
jgi:hypothetical protein